MAACWYKFGNIPTVIIGYDCNDKYIQSGAATAMFLIQYQLR